MISWNRIDVFRGETQVLWEVSLQVGEGERVAILGSNGAGKTTLLLATVGLLGIRNGQISFKGMVLNGKRPHEIARLGIALVPEGRRVYKDMTVYENLLMGSYPVRGKISEEKELDFIYGLFPILKKRKHQRAGTMSGGEQQMLAIGRALMSKPHLLLLDELSLGLAPLVTKEIYRVIDGLPKNTTVLLVEQNVEEALKHSHRAYVLETGKIIKEGPSSELYSDESIRKAYLGL